MKIRVQILLIAAATAIGFPPFLAAYGPGGNTIAAGFEKQSRLREDFGEVVFFCPKCAVSACISLQALNDGNIRFQVRTASAGVFNFSSVRRQHTNVLCAPDITGISAACRSSNCEYEWRMDDISNTVIVDNSDSPP